MAGGFFHDSHAARSQAVEGLPLATFRARAAAFVLDGLLLLAILLAVRLPFGAFANSASAGRITVVFDTERLWDLLAVVAYFALFTWLMSGQTPGKRVLGIRVVSVTHERLTLWQCVERALGYVASTLELGFGFLQYYLHANRQTVHDRIAGTVVVDTSAARAAGPTPPPAPNQARLRRGKRRRHPRKR